MQETKAVLYPKQREGLTVGNVTFRSLYDDQVTENDLKKARLELGETEERKEASLLKLRNALIRDKDFNYRLDDEYLLRFLRYRKYDDKMAYSSVRKFYEYRTERPDLFDVSHKLEFFLRRDISMYLPYRDEEGCIIFWNDTNNWKVEEMSLMDMLNMGHAIVDVISMNPCLQINGLVGLFDFKGLTASHIRQFANLTAIKTFFRTMQSVYPWRVKRLIALNCNLAFRGIYNAFYYLFKKKITDRIVLLGSDFSELHQYVNPRILPKKYGGCIETSECSVAEHILNNLSYIKYERSFGPSTEF